MIASEYTILIPMTAAYKELIRRWDSERELLTTTSYTYCKIRKLRYNF